MTQQATDMEGGLPARRKALRERITWDWELAAWVVILVLALVTRLWALGDRAMSHDESLHTFYSWKLFMEGEYRHDPMMHGPLLYHFNALSYFLFGVSDFTARLHPVIAGLLLVFSPLLVRKWLGRVGALTTATILLVSPTVMMYSRYIRHDIPVELFTVLMFVGFLRYLDDRGSRWVVLALAAAAGAITSAEMSYINGFVLVTFIVLALLAEALPKGRRPLLAGILAVAGVAVLVIAEFAMGGQLDSPLVAELDLVAGLLIAWAIGLALMSGVGGRPGLWARIKEVPLDGLLAGVAVFAVIYVLMFTTFFTQPDRWNGFVTSIQYWLDQHGVERGSQPWYYYLLFAPMYEYPSVVLLLTAIVYYLRKPFTRFARGNDAPEGEPPSPAAWLYVPMTATWAIGVFWIYSWAGEKMPWLLVHLVVPMAFLGGRLVADVAEGLDVDAWRARGWQVAALVAAALYVIVAGLAGGGAGGEGAATIRLVAGLLVGLALLGGAFMVGRGLPSSTRRVALAAGFGVLLLGLNVRDSVRANFVNDELANEYIVYAHGTPDDKDVYERLLEMQALKGDADALEVGYDNEVSWPFTWYFRNTDWTTTPYYFGEKPGSVSKLKDQDAVLVGSPNYAEFEPWLRDDYVALEYQRMWWPNEGYKGLTLTRLAEVLRDRNQLANLRNILVNRRYALNPKDPDSPEKPLTDWYHQANMKLFIRKDTIEQLWPVAEARPTWLSGLDTTVVEREYPQVELAVEQVFPSAGGEALAQPKAIAVSASGDLWVVDHGNEQLARFDADGTRVELVAEGQLEYEDSGNPGTFWPSAWGVEAGDDGAVYVADTWNHQVVRYVDGRFDAAFGIGGAPPDDPLAMETIDSLFGPRDVALRDDGHLFLTDTGNKRIIELNADLEPVRAIGGHGTAPGEFNEPTSLAFDPISGELYVADLWNLRVQVFDRDLRPVREWPVDGWGSEEAAHKSYLDVYPGGIVAVTDPVGARVWFYDAQGTTLGTLELTSDPEGLMEPIGVAWGPVGEVYVASSANNRVTRFSAPDFLEPRSPGAAEAESDTDDEDADTGDDADGADAQSGTAAAEGEADEATVDPDDSATPTDGAPDDESSLREDGDGAEPTRSDAAGSAALALAAFLEALDPDIAEAVEAALAAGEDAASAAEAAGLDERRAERLAQLVAAVRDASDPGASGAPGGVDPGGAASATP